MMLGTVVLEFGHDAAGNTWVSASSDPLNQATPRKQTQYDAQTNRLAYRFNDEALVNPYDADGNLQNHPHIG
jgi:hypothetical protein